MKSRESSLRPFAPDQKCFGHRAALLFSALCLLAGPVSAPATALRRGDVASQAAWVVHLDIDRLRPSPIGQYILSELEKPDADARLKIVQKMTGIDPRKQLHAVTLYGTSAGAEHGALLAYADFDARNLEDLAKAAKDSRSSSYKDYTIYNWIEHGGKDGAHDDSEKRAYAAIKGDRVVFARHEDDVKSALDVLDGVAPSLNKAKTFPLIGASGNTSFLEAGATKLQVPESNPNAAVLRMAKALQLQARADQQKLNADLTLEANDDDVAANISSIAQGLLGLLKSQSDKPQALKLGQALAVKQEGTRVTVSLSLASSDAVQMLKEHAEQREARRERREGKTQD